jgi:hypothetical protein
MSRYILLQDSKTSVTSYSSGPLNVGDVTELIFDYKVTAASGGSDTSIGVGHDLTINISRVTPFGELVAINGLVVDYHFESSGPVINAPSSVHAIDDSGFGDRIQLDLYNPNDATVSFELSVVGK